MSNVPAHVMIERLTELRAMINARAASLANRLNFDPHSEATRGELNGESTISLLEEEYAEFVAALDQLLPAKNPKL